GLGELGMRVDRDAAAIVVHDDAAIGMELELDAAGMAGHGFVHRIVEDFGDEVVEGALVGAADIHAGAAADRLQPFEDFDILRRIARTRFPGVGLVKQIRHGSPTIGSAKRPDKLPAGVMETNNHYSL